MRIEIADIKIDPEVYPRDGYDNEALARYGQALERLPPITVNRDYELIDGFHRLLAHQTAGKTDIEVDIMNIPHDEMLVTAIRLNAMHGKQLSIAEKRRHARTLWRQRATGHIDAEIQEWIAELLSISERTVSEATKDVRKEQKEEEQEQAWQLWLACKSQEDIAEILGVSQQTISSWTLPILENFPKLVIASFGLIGAMMILIAALILLLAAAITTSGVIAAKW